MHQTLGLPLIIFCLALPPGIGGENAAQTPGKTELVADRFPERGPTSGLEAEVLDHRYQPGVWQTCIGLPDDPYKTIVGSDGGLYYEYGKRGPEPYSNGQGTFGTRVRLGFEAAGEAEPIRQALHSPRIPLVVTEWKRGDWTVHLEAWSAALQGETVADRSPQRVDYAWLKATNRGSGEARGTVVVDIGTPSRLGLDASRTKLLCDGAGDRIFARFSRPADPPAEPVTGGDRAETRRVQSSSGMTVQRDWAQPKVACDSCFRHVLVGFGQPLTFRLAAPAERKATLALGFIEGWHAEPGKRPLRIQVEGQADRELDLVREFGRNLPVIQRFAATDENGDGYLAVAVQPVAGAEDGNTVLSGLWAFPVDQAPGDEEILAGRAGGSAWVRVDADHLPDMPRPIRLTWDTGSIAAGATIDLFVALPQGAQVQRELGPDDPNAARERCVAWWNAADLPYGRITVPDPSVQGLLDSCIRNIYQAREWKEGQPMFQVGPTCYRGTWAADGPFLLEAVTYLGRSAEARAGLEQQVDGDTGPGGVEFSKKSGLRLWMIYRHAQLTGDRDWLRRMWPRVQREANQIVAYRNMTRDDPRQANYGLMPIGFGDGGLGGKHREYTNVYWTLAGLKCAIEVAERLEEPVAATWRAEYADYWRTFDLARRRDKQVDAAGNTYVPVTMSGEQPQLPQRGAWAFLQSVFPGRIFDDEDRLMLGTLAMLDANQREGLIYGTGWIEDGIWNYAGSFYAHTHLWLGHGRKAAATLYAFGNHTSPLLCWREEQNPVGERPQYVGDMPHNWASAEFVRLVRHLLILERGEELHLLQGLPRAWTGANGVTRLQEVPTSFGTISLNVQITEDGRSARIDIEPPRREPPRRLVVHLEPFARPVSAVTLDGRRLDGPVAELPGDRTCTLRVDF